MAEDNIKKEEIVEEEEKEEEIEDEPKTYSETDYKKLQSESIKRKGKIDKIEVELQKFKDDKLTESEKKDARIKELETEKDMAVQAEKDSKVQTMIMAQVSTKGFADVDVAMLIIKEELKLEEDITEATIKKAVGKVAKEKPYLIGGTNTDIKPGNFEAGTNPEGGKSADELLQDLLREKM